MRINEQKETMIINNKAEQSGMDTQKLLKTALRIVTTIYVALMLVVFPLYYRDAYFDIDVAKYSYFHLVTMGSMMGLLIFSIIYGIFYIEELSLKKVLKSLSGTDWCMISYGILALVSYLVSDYKSEALHGYAGWYMGLVTQLYFILIYFYVSRYYRHNKWITVAFIASFTVVFMLGVLHRFSMDPLGMYAELSEGYSTGFISTIGNINWFAGYMSTVFPIGIYYFWQEGSLKRRILAGIAMEIGFACAITQGSESGLIGLAVILLAFFAFSFAENYKMRHYIEMWISMCIAFRIVGIMRLIWHNTAVPLDGVLFSAATKGKGSFILLTALIFIYGIYLTRFEKKGGKLETFRWIRTMVFILLGVGTLSYVILGSIVTCHPNAIPTLAGNSYLTFTNEWGNGRGYIWKFTVNMYTRLPFVNQLFGVGPECYPHYAYGHFETLLNEWENQFGSGYITNAHNETLTALINYGLFGCIAYMGIYVSAILRFMKSSKREPLLIGFGVAVLAYTIHNMVSFQQVIGTSTVVILIGIGESLLRSMRE